MSAAPLSLAQTHTVGFADDLGGTWGPLLARFYESMRVEYPNERAFWQSLVRPGDRVLEIGAGSGFISAALLVSGASSLTLVEPEPTNVALLEKCLHATAAPIRAEVLQAPFGEVIVPQQDLILFPYDSLPMVTTRAGRHQIFAKARQYLSPGGRFALHISTQHWVDTYIAQTSELASYERQLMDGTRVKVTRVTKKISDDHYLKFFTLTEVATATTENYLVLTSVVTPEEILAHADSCAFELSERYGDFNRGPASLDEDIFVFTAR